MGARLRLRASRLSNNRRDPPRSFGLNSPSTRGRVPYKYMTAVTEQLIDITGLAERLGVGERFVRFATAASTRPSRSAPGAGVIAVVAVAGEEVVVWRLARGCCRRVWGERG